MPCNRGTVSQSTSGKQPTGDDAVPHTCDLHNELHRLAPPVWAAIIRTAFSCSPHESYENFSGFFMRHVISALVQNVPGVLAHVAGMFASRGYNIDSLAVGETESANLSRMTFVVTLSIGSDVFR